jgi:plastocyanin
MRTFKTPSILLKRALVVCLAVSAPLANADNDRSPRTSVNASFGRGLNTAVPGNPVNHAILPKQISVKVGGVVDFGVAGFHDIVIFKPGVRLDDLLDGTGQLPLFPPVYVLPPDPATPLPAASAFLADQIYYRGINPAGGPLGTPAVVNPSNAENRSEPVAFLAGGTYLVICNIRPHLLDGMYAYVKVSE